MKGTRVLLPEVVAAREFRADKGYGFSVDYSVYLLVVEELISLGMVGMAVLAGSDAAKIVSLLPAPIRRCVSVINPKPQAQKVDHFLKPIIKEMKLEVSYPDYPILAWEARHEGNISDDLMQLMCACGTLRLSLFLLLIGMQHELELELNLEKLRADVGILRSELKSPNARNNLAVLEGVLGSYAPVELQSVEVRSSASLELISLFDQVLCDDNYQALAQHGYSLGFPERIRSGIQGFAASSRRFIRYSKLSQFLEYAARGVELALSIPAPDKRFFGKILGERYFPPILPLNSVRERAQNAWLRVLPSPIPANSERVGNVVWGKAFIPGREDGNETAISPKSGRGV